MIYLIAGATHTGKTAYAQRLLETASGVLRVYVRCVAAGQTALDVDADCSAVELAMALESNGQFVIHVDGSLVDLRPRLKAQNRQA